MANSGMRSLTRREFIRRSCAVCAGAGLFGPLLNVWQPCPARAQKTDAASLREAMFYEPISNRTVQCRVCFRECVIRPGQRGFCRNKENIGGTLYSVVYGRPSAIQIDPIEKEPSLHMLPGSLILCFGTAGCNFRCMFCQNWHLSQQPLEKMAEVFSVSPAEAVALAQEKNIPTISFTYNEPTSCYEYVYDTARQAKQNGLRMLWHSNGALNPEPLRELLRYTDAVTVDLKGFTPEFYQRIAQAQLDPVLQSLKIIREQGVWLELVNLHIPVLNDDPESVRQMCTWIKDNLGDYTPLHFSRFFPNYQLTAVPATPVSSLEKAYDIARGCGLQFVTIGNVPGHTFNSTFCPGCGNVLIRRTYFRALENNIREGTCGFCGRIIPGIWT